MESGDQEPTDADEVFMGRIDNSIRYLFKNINFWKMCSKTSSNFYGKCDILFEFL